MLTEAYIQALQLCAVYVFGAEENSLSRIGWSAEPQRTLEDLSRSSCRRITTVQMVFVSSDAVAIMLTEAAQEHLRSIGTKKSGAWWCRDIAGTMSAVVDTAHEVGVPVVSEHEIEVAAVAIVGRVEREIEALRKSGGLREINAAYRAHRLALTAAGKPVPTYPKWFSGYKAGLVKTLADHQRIFAREPLGVIAAAE